MTGDVLLVAMPWEMLEFPSIQLGTLEALLRQGGLPVRSRSAKLPFWDHCLKQTRDEPGPLALDDYDAIALSHWRVGLGDWIFSDRSHGSPGNYIDYLRQCAVPETWIRKAQRMRELVPSFLEAEVERIASSHPAVVGFTSSFNQNIPSLTLARMIKMRLPETRILLGGANCDGPMGAALLRAFPWVDVVVRGEAELVLPGLVNELLAGRRITPAPGLCFREEGSVVIVPEAGGKQVSMEDVPLPDYDEYFETLKATGFHGDVQSQVTLLYESGRGCWWGEKSTCTFCGLNSLNMTFRAKRADCVERELTELASRYRRLSFQIVDNIIAHNYYEDLFPRLGAAGHDFSFFVETKANLSWRHVTNLRRAGVQKMLVGIESLSTPVLQLMSKGTTGFINIRTLVYCARAGVTCFWNLLYGFPGEPESEYLRMAELLPSLSHLQPPSAYRLRLDRFSPYHTNPAAFGINLTGPSPHYRMLYPEVPPEILADLAYTFDYTLPAGQAPDVYATPLLDAVKRWQIGHGSAELSTRQGPGFLLINDRRPGFESASYTLGSLGRQIYEACEHGATARRVLQDISNKGEALPSLRQVERFLEELTGLRLLYEEDGRFLSLAIPNFAGTTETVPQRAEVLSLS